MTPQTADLIAALQRTLAELDLTEMKCGGMEDDMSTRDTNADRPQPRPFAGRGKVVIRDAWNVETAGSIPAAQTNHNLRRQQR